MLRPTTQGTREVFVLAFCGVIISCVLLSSTTCRDSAGFRGGDGPDNDFQRENSAGGLRVTWIPRLGACKRLARGLPAMKGLSWDSSPCLWTLSTPKGHFRETFSPGPNDAPSQKLSRESRLRLLCSWSVSCGKGSAGSSERGRIIHEASLSPLITEGVCPAQWGHRGTHSLLLLLLLLLLMFVVLPF